MRLSLTPYDTVTHDLNRMLTTIVELMMDNMAVLWGVKKTKTRAPKGSRRLE